MRKARATTLSTFTLPRRGSHWPPAGRSEIDPYEWGGKSHCTCRGGLYIRPRAPAFSASLLQNATRHGRIYNAPLHAKSMVHRIVGRHAHMPPLMSHGVSDSFVGAAISRPRVNRRSTPTATKKTQAASAAWVFTVYSSFGGSSVRVGINCRATLPLPRRLT